MLFLRTNPKCSQDLQAYEIPLRPDQSFTKKRKRSQGTEDPVYQQPSPSASNLYEESPRNRRDGIVSPESCPEELDNHYPTTRNITDSRISEVEPKGLGKESKGDPISYWAVNHFWPENFAEGGIMPLSNNTNKRKRPLDRPQTIKDEKPPSCSKSRETGDAPEQYTKAYEIYILTHGLDMNNLKGKRFVSPESKEYCGQLRNTDCATISPALYSGDKILQVVDLCQNANEALVGRDVTTLILPPMKALQLSNEAEIFKNLIDQVQAQWHESWVLVGPRPEPDVAIGFSSSAFTAEENQKLTNYRSFGDLVRPTNDMYFPFLMVEVKCGDKGLDYADRQSMHSCSVAIKALLKLEQISDEYRDDKHANSLSGKVLVYSISHDQTNARVWGHYALMEGEQWIYYRYFIDSFDNAYKEGDLLALHNLARKILTGYAPELLKRLQGAIAALPVLSTPPCPTSTISLEDSSQQGSQQPSHDRGLEGLVVPVLTNGSGNESMLQQKMQRQEQENIELKERNKKLMEDVEKLMDMLKQRID